MTKEDIEIQAALYEDSCHNPNIQTHFIEGAEWVKENIIDKTCEFLDKYAVQYTEPIGGDIDTYKMCEDLKKYVIEGVEPIFDLEE